MNVITPGYSYELVTTDLVTYPSGLMPITFDNPDDPGGAITGVSTSLEVIEMMIDRYLHLGEYNTAGTESCSVTYRLAAKAEKIVKSYVDDVETA